MNGRSMSGGELQTRSVRLVRCFADSPVGRLRLLATDAGLVGVDYPEHRHGRDPEADTVERHPVLDLARRELTEYFAGERTHFETLLAPPAIRGGTAFQCAVWDALLAIPFGETRTYAEVARFIGRPHAVRAVGAANAQNPISILVPCHRVIGSDGSLTGYAGGIAVKKWLLAREARQQSIAFGRSAERSPALDPPRRRPTGFRETSRDPSSPLQ